MISQDLKQYKLPDKPGVYRFYQGKNLLYIGKATSLKDRVRSYFAGDLGETPASAGSSGVAKRGPKIWRMVEIADRIEWQETDSVLEALLLETELIKKHQPKYNSREKDDKSYWYVVITDEDYPRVLSVRGKELFSKSYQLKAKSLRFGPFPYATEIKEALKIIRKIFPYRDTCVPGASLRGCFNRQIGLCPGVCTSEISKTDYRKIVRNIKLLFSGKKQEILRNLEKEMKVLAKKQEFEKAGKIRDQIFALNHIRDVSLLKNNGAIGGADRSPTSACPQCFATQGRRGSLEVGLHKNSAHSIRIEAYDIAHLSGKKTVGAMTVWQDGELDKSEYKKFELRGPKANQADDPANLREILERRFNHPGWGWPDIIVVDGNQVQVNVVQSVIGGLTSGQPLEERPPISQKIAIIGVTKDAKHKASKLLGDQHIIHDYHRAIIEVNAEAHRFAISYHRKKMREIL